MLFFLDLLLTLYLCSHREMAGVTVETYFLKSCSSFIGHKLSLFQWIIQSNIIVVKEVLVSSSQQSEKCEQIFLYTKKTKSKYASFHQGAVCSSGKIYNHQPNECHTS